jgi:hypothetical protein
MKDRRKPKIIRSCNNCGKTYKTSFSLSKFCSKVCQSKSNNARYNKNQTVISATTSRSTVGAISELRVCYDLMRRGFDVFRAMSPNSYADVIAIKNNIIYQLEVRTGRYLVGGTLYWPTNKLANKSLVVYTFRDDKIHYITNPELSNEQIPDIS